MRLPEKVPFVPKDFDFGALLDELSRAGRLPDFFEIADNKYYYRDKWKYLAQQWEIDPKKLWGASEDRDRYLISSLMEEAIASSQLEGAATTRKIAKEMLKSNRKPKNTSKQMILHNYEAMKWIVKNKDTAFSVKSIKQVHSILTKSRLSDQSEEGRFRVSNDIGVVDVQSGLQP